MIEKLKSLNSLEKSILLGILMAFLLFVITFSSTPIYGLLSIGQLLTAIYLLDKQIEKYQDKRDERERKILRMAYRERLESLRQQPNNSQMKDAALKAGRAYYGSLKLGAVALYTGLWRGILVIAL